MITNGLLRNKIIICLVVFCSSASRAEYHGMGIAFGYGGTGITKNLTINGNAITVNKSETPGVISFNWDFQWSDRLLITLEHIRGFRLGPFSSGVGLTGISSKWYFRDPIPSMIKTSSSDSTLLIKQWSPFVGGALGIASGEINREGDEVSSVSSSGIYFGLRTGADYQYEANRVLRTQISFSSTIPASTPYSQVFEFSMSAGIIFFVDWPN